MQANIHTPERLPNETVENYRQRRAESKRRARMGRYIRSPGHNPERNAARKAKRLIGARQFRRDPGQIARLGLTA